MRRILILTAIATPDLAFADPGHLGNLAGHSHWIALGALGIATAIGALASAKGKTRHARAEQDASSGEAPESQEAEA